MRKAFRIASLLLVGVLLIAAAYYATEAVSGAYNRRYYFERVNDKSTARGTTYYVNASGDDSNDGKTPAQAWRTITKVNSINFAASDRVLFAAGESFKGNLRFDYKDAGTPARPIVVSSYGEGRAGVEAGAGDGISVHFANFRLVVPSAITPCAITSAKTTDAKTVIRRYCFSAESKTLISTETPCGLRPQRTERLPP